MTKKLLVQIKNEWRNNLWLALELLVVSVVMWFVVDYLYNAYGNLSGAAGLRHQPLLPYRNGKAYR